MSLHEEIEQICENDVKERHSFFQLQFFLIGKEPTNQAKMWRCIRELKTRKESMSAVKMEIDDVNDDISLLDIEIGKSKKNIEKQHIKNRKDEILLRKSKRKKTGLTARLNALNEKLASLEEESAFIIKAFRSLEKLEELKPYDDLNAQKQYWNEKLGQEFNLRLLFGLPPDLELIKTILALNSDAPVKVDTLNYMDSVQKKVENKELDLILEKTQNIESKDKIATKEKYGI
ncbi:MAG: hypothetical protein DWQ19_12560 [Crenarchaeota archaeon]|nr:MAG: hypothetical protein DWQ19_12560 [Thermoproteota archaeon]